MKKWSLIFCAIVFMGSWAGAAEFQNNPAPKKGETICSVKYTSLVPNRKVVLDLSGYGFDKKHLENYDLTTGTYSKVGEIAIFKGAGNYVDIGYGSADDKLKIKSEGLALSSDQVHFTLNGTDQVMAKVIFEIDNFIKVSCATNP